MAEKASMTLCPQCSGKGAIQCPTCHGQGKKFMHANINQRPCRDCHGKGKIVCPQCRGTRKVKGL